MTTLFGVPLFGTLFVPLAVGLLTLVFIWTFVLSNNSLQSTVLSNELQKNVTEESSVLETKGKTKEKKEKKCGGSGSCSSKKDGKSVGCCSTIKSIETAKVFVDKHSSICQEFAVVLSKQLTASLTIELINVTQAEAIDLTKHADGSLCVFLTDTSVINEHHHWIPKAVSNLANGGKPLAGMKYSAFTIQPLKQEKSRGNAIDQLLHKSGAVRVCRAETAEISAASFSNPFDDWAEELLAQVQRWNTPKKTACKCGPKKKTDEYDGSCSSSSKCSDSEDEDKRQSETAVPVLDLEDIAKLL